MLAWFRRKIAVAAFLPGLALAASGDGPARMDHIAQVYAAQDGFSGSVLVSREGKTMLDKGYGTAANAPHPIGAIAMQFTAAALLLLQQDGKLRLDDPLSAYLPETPPGWSGVTLRHLLTHRAGLGHDESPVAKPPTEALMRQVFGEVPTPEPDKRFGFSPSGYALLGLVVEKVSGLPYSAFLNRRLFAPQGMKATVFQADTGQIVSTVRDLAAWETALYGGKVLSPASLQEMTRETGEGFYGLGLYILPDKDGPFYGHDGDAGDGAGGVLGYRPKDRTIVAVLGALGPARDLATKLSDVAHGEKVVLKSEQKSTALPNVLIPTEKLAMPGLDRDRGLRIYVPPGYSAHPDRRYPVLYMHDGQNLFDAKTAYAAEWGVDETLDELAKTDGFEAIVVGIDNGPKRMSEYNPYPGPELKEAEGPEYMRFIAEMVKPYIDRTYRTLPDRAHTAIMGSSMGGLISHYALQAYPQVFSKYGVFSPSYWASPELVARAEKTPVPADTRIYIFVGHLEGPHMEDPARKMADTLTREAAPGSVAYHVEPEGKHSETTWRPEFRTAVRWLFEGK